MWFVFRGLSKIRSSLITLTPHVDGDAKKINNCRLAAEFKLSDVPMQRNFRPEHHSPEPRELGCKPCGYEPGCSLADRDRTATRPSCGQARLAR